LGITAGARNGAGTPPVAAFGPGDATASGSERPIGQWAFAGVAIASFGGPLALAALIAPGLAAGAPGSAGLEMVVAVVVFAAPLAIWLRYSRHINGPGGLYAFVEAAAGRKVALAQAAIWITSYLLYVVYTTVQIVYDVLPGVLPGERRHQTLLLLLIPVAIAAVMIAGRAAALLVIGLIAFGQLALAGILDGVTLAHVSTPISTFGTSAGAGSLAKAGVQTSFLYICGSLPVFLGGELRNPARTMRRGLTGAFLLTGVVVTLAVAPLAASPGLLGTDFPGVRLAQHFSGSGLADAIAIGVGASIAGLILLEYLALIRLVHAISSWRMNRIAVAIGIALLIAAPLSLIDPRGFYSDLTKPSLIALWLSQLIVFAVYPLFARKRGQRALPAWTLSLVASGLAIYGLVVAVQQSTS
jgi:amino acid transporter